MQGRAIRAYNVPTDLVRLVPHLYRATKHVLLRRASPAFLRAAPWVRSSPKDEAQARLSLPTRGLAEGAEGAEAGTRSTSLIINSAVPLGQPVHGIRISSLVTP